jgi:hypothetical protein
MTPSPKKINRDTERHCFERFQKLNRLRGARFCRAHVGLSSATPQLDGLDIGQPINNRRRAFESADGFLKVTRTARFEKPAQDAARVRR